MTPHVVIVEPYLSGGLLPAPLARLGIACVGLHLRPMTHAIAATFRAEEYPQHIVYPGSPDALARELDGLRVVAVMAGQEAGVELADILSETFGTPANDPSLSAARRDKYVMHQRIAAAGLRPIRQTRSDAVERLVAWIEENRCWPAVVKPVNSGGTDGVRFCRNPAEVGAAFDAAIGRTNLLGFANRAMLAQEAIAGTEFIVDAVSCRGDHRIVNVARYEKEVTMEGAPIYRAIQFLDPDEWAAYRPMLDYVRAVLDALGITTGPSHSEVFVDQAGPVLVETGARLCGAMVPRYLDEISTGSILDLAVAAYVDPARYAALAARRWRHHARLCAFVLRSRRSGRLTGRPGEQAIRRLPSFHDVWWLGRIGEPVIPTRDLMSSVGIVFLRSSDRFLIKRDIAALRHLEEHDELITT